LDQTILHASKDQALNALLLSEGKEEDQVSYYASSPSLWHAIREIHKISFDECAPGEYYFIKLRPGLQEFLREISLLFDLHVYTMGSRSYARAVVNLFDMDGRYLQGKIISRDESQQSGFQQQRKHLKKIFPTDDKTVLIVDDRADVWDYCRSLIPVPPCTTTTTRYHGTNFVYLRKWARHFFPRSR
jgi:RNA polymerase II subunit A-like phosphatase